MDVKELNIYPDGGKTLLGNHFHELKDETAQTFSTDSLEAFLSYLVDKQQGRAIYFGETSCTLKDVEAKQNSITVAECKLNESMSLKALKGSIGRELSILDLEKLLTSLRRQVPGVLPILSQLRDMSVSKNQKYDRQTDNKGNFKLHIERTAGPQDWVTPETIVFNVPVFEYLPETVEIETDFLFEMKDEGARPVFVLQNLNLSEIIQERKREIMEKRLSLPESGITCPRYWGNANVKPMTDAWRFQANPLK